MIFCSVLRMKANHSVTRSQLMYAFLAAILLCASSIILLDLSISNLIQKFCMLSTHYKYYQVKTPDVTLNTDMRTSQTTVLPGDISHTWYEDEVKNFPIFILSAIGSNTTSHGYAKSEVKLNGWTVRRFENTAFKCCILLISSFRYEYLHPYTMKGRNYTELSASQITCPLNAPLHHVRGVTLSRVESECPRKMTSYLKPYIPQKIDIEESFAICLKLLYGQVNNEYFKNWIEYNIEIGVDKIVMFTYNISDSTTNLLKKYIKLGYIEKRPFEIPMKRNYKIGDKTASYYEDERVIMLDCRQRLSGYKYMAVVDKDEFLLPRKHENVKEMMEKDEDTASCQWRGCRFNTSYNFITRRGTTIRIPIKMDDMKYLMKKTPNAAGFHIKSYLFLNSEEPGFSLPLNDSNNEMYFKRTGALSGKLSRQKNIILPSRIKLSGYGAHNFKVLQGYNRVQVNTSVASLNHYRNCYKNIEANCTEPLTTDTFILKFVERIRNRTLYSDT